MHIYTYMYINIYIYIYINKHVYIYICIIQILYKDTHVHIHIHMYIIIYVSCRKYDRNSTRIAPIRKAKPPKRYSMNRPLSWLFEFFFLVSFSSPDVRRGR